MFNWLFRKSEREKALASITPISLTRKKYRFNVASLSYDYFEAELDAYDLNLILTQTFIYDPLRKKYINKDKVKDFEEIK